MKKITLTFDNGPTPGVTERVLDILRARGVRATFFVVGDNLRDDAAVRLLDRISADGHWIGAHSMTHSVALGERDDAAYTAHEIGEPQRMLGERNPRRLFRPYGNLGLTGPHLLSERAVAYLIEHRYTCILWNSVPHDWDDPQHWVERCLADVARLEWTVAVLHDIPGAALDRLDELLDRLDEMGVACVLDFPEAVVLTRGGREVSLRDDYVAGRAKTAP